MAPLLWFLLSLFGPNDTPGGPIVQNAPVTLHIAENGTPGVDSTLTA
jgi:hypothetical protein